MGMGASLALGGIEMGMSEITGPPRDTPTNKDMLAIFVLMVSLGFALLMTGLFLLFGWY